MLFNLTALSIQSVREPSTQIEAIVGAVDVLEATGESINRGQANSLRATLNRALALVANDQAQPAIRLLVAFTHKVLAYVTNGSLTFDDGQDLILAAQSVITDLLAELEEATP